MAKKAGKTLTIELIFGTAVFFVLDRYMEWSFFAALGVAVLVMIIIFLIEEVIRKIMDLPSDLEKEEKEELIWRLKERMEKSIHLEAAGSRRPPGSEGC